MTDPSSGPGPGADRHTILRQLRQQLERHPAIEAARGKPDDEYAEVTARVDPSFFSRDADSGSLRLVWYPTPRIPEDGGRSQHRGSTGGGPRTRFDSVFKLHYSEAHGYDCGFHNEPNPHVDGWFHFQERTTPDADYVYTPARLDARTPIGALWEILDSLEETLRDTP